MFAMYAAPDSHHGDGREGVWVRATMTNQTLMVQAAPDRFFVPPYVGPYGWVGVYIDSPRTDWDELAELLRDAWRMSAPKRLVAKHESPSSTVRPPKRTSATASKAAKRPTTKTTTTRKSATKKSATRKSPATTSSTKRTVRRR
jgi:hypothetical protein